MPSGLSTDRLAVTTAILSTLFALSACSSHAATPAPTSAPPAPTVAGYTDAEKTALVAENIDEVWCGEEPTPDWCSKLHRVDGTPDVSVQGTSLFVATTMAETAKARDLAEDMCSAIATASFDENAEPIGFLHVHVQAKDPEVFLADCDVR